LRPHRAYVLTDSQLRGEEDRLRVRLGSVSITPIIVRTAHFRELRSLAEEILAENSEPVIIVICAGGNDIFARRDRTRDPPHHDRDRITIRAYRRCRSVLTDIRQLAQAVSDHHINSRIIFGTIPPRLNPSAVERRALLGVNAEVIGYHRQAGHHPAFLDRFVGRRRRGHLRARRNRLVRSEGVHAVGPVRRRFTEEILLRIREAMDSLN